MKVCDICGTQERVEANVDLGVHVGTKRSFAHGFRGSNPMHCVVCDACPGCLTALWHEIGVYIRGMSFDLLRESVKELQAAEKQ